VTRVERSLADVSSLLEVDRPRRVDVATFSGPLVLLILGLSVSVVIAAAEITYYRQRGRVSTVEISKQKPGASLGRRIAYSPQCRQRTAILLLQLL